MPARPRYGWRRSTPTTQFKAEFRFIICHVHQSAQRIHTINLVKNFYWIKNLHLQFFLANMLTISKVEHFSIVESA